MSVHTFQTKARQAGLWNLFLQSVSGLDNVDYAHIAEHLGRSPMYSEVFNCAAPGLFLRTRTQRFLFTVLRVCAKNVLKVEYSIFRCGDALAHVSLKIPIRF